MKEQEREKEGCGREGCPVFKDTRCINCCRLSSQFSPGIKIIFQFHLSALSVCKRGWKSGVVVKICVTKVNVGLIIHWWRIDVTRLSERPRKQTWLHAHNAPFVGDWVPVPRLECFRYLHFQVFVVFDRCRLLLVVYLFPDSNYPFILFFCES